MVQIFAELRRTIKLISAGQTPARPQSAKICVNLRCLATPVREAIPTSGAPTRRFGGRPYLRHSANVPNDSDPRRRRVLADKIKDTRAARHCSSQARLAAAAGISERSIAGAEAGEEVGRKTLAAIEAVFGWPTRKTTDYLNGDDNALAALPTQGPPLMSAAAKWLAEAGLTMDVVPSRDNVTWLRELRTSLGSDHQFFQLIDEMSRPAGSSGNRG